VLHDFIFGPNELDHQRDVGFAGFTQITAAIPKNNILGGLLRNR